ncbi:MAG: DUF4160 domain-containing protein, partial [Ideonella sp.]
MYAGDRNPPHFHVLANDGSEALIDLECLQVIDGTVRPAVKKEALAWASQNVALLATKWKETEPMRPKQFILTSVKTTPTASLLLRYADGEQFEVGLVDTIKQHPSLERLKDPTVFGLAKVGDHGASVIWANDDDLELAADNLRARAVEQAGG